ncbi:hypothetical protein BAY61_01310 [Prauserella marina]|uniref:Uncharacterized protein n=1 Tax=Prauserella marina TaxID=530584 RepID=A0A222VIV1_9PSEU|nr:hypothetical protein [Prauserella marina]ASR33848.1 hypothetical protein BAY61_01310 [Prauserella marina]SDC69139.1 hypothetical protein SAMN05421630_103214 [Prauserella marina]
MADVDDFDSVLREPDPVSRARRASKLLTHYQQRATELARLRKAAIEQAHREKHLSYTEIAAALGISKGRITQIRSSAPGPERAFFGVGPVQVGVPLRRGTDHRMRTYIDASDALAQEQAETVLTSLSLASERFSIEPELEKLPDGDAVIICGPRSAPVAGHLLENDSKLGFAKEDGRWRIEDHVSGEQYYSPRLEDPPSPADFGYFARHRMGDRVVVHVAGITAVGSSGVLHYLTSNVRELYNKLGDTSFSMAVRCTFASDETTITGSELVAGPYGW